METIFISSNKNTGPIQLIGEGEDLSDVSIASILDLYKRHGLIWFRNFKTDVELFEEFSQSFTEKFLVFPQASDVRKALNSDGSLKTVDLSPRPIPLHSEMAYMPEGLKPEIAWFYCASASDGSGATTAADGAELANLLRDSSKYDSLLSKDILYTQEWDMDRWRQFTGAETVDELDEWIKSKGYFDVMKIDSEGVLHLSRISPLLTKPKFQEQSVFVNTILHQNYRSERFVPVPFSDGSYVSEEDFKEWKDLAETVTIDIKWKTGDFVMLDNTRYMHGRRLPGSDRKLLAKFGLLREL